MSKILDVNQSYTFSQIFELKIELDDLAAEFGYTFQRTRLNRPQYVGDLSRLADLRSRLEPVMPYVSLNLEKILFYYQPICSIALVNELMTIQSICQILYPIFVWDFRWWLEILKRILFVLGVLVVESVSLDRLAVLR